MQHIPDDLSGLNWPLSIHDAKLVELREQFPQFRIWREVMGRGARYIARRLSPGTRLHTVVTADHEELRAILAAATVSSDPGAHGRAAMAALPRQRQPE
jgi:hypothetical protein